MPKMFVGVSDYNWFRFPFTLFYIFFSDFVAVADVFRISVSFEPHWNDDVGTIICVVLVEVDNITIFCHT